MFCSSQARPRYKVRFISFIEESKCIWLHGQTAKFQSWWGNILGTKMVDLEPFSFHLRPMRGGLFPIWFEMAIEISHTGGVGPDWSEDSSSCPIGRDGSLRRKCVCAQEVLFQAHCYGGVAFPIFRVVVGKINCPLPPKA